MMGKAFETIDADQRKRTGNYVPCAKAGVVIV